MFSVTVRDHVMVAHSFTGAVFGPAQALHGATFVVDATFRRPDLDADHIVVDIGRATTALGAVLDDAPDEVAGLDVALRTVAEHTLGTTALAIASLGFAAYGLSCLVDDYARHP